MQNKRGRPVGVKSERNAPYRHGPNKLYQVCNQSKQISTSKVQLRFKNPCKKIANIFLSGSLIDVYKPMQENNKQISNSKVSPTEVYEPRQENILLYLWIIIVL